MHKNKECPYCKKMFSAKGIQTHIMRSHTKQGFKGSTGKNNSYQDPAYQEKLSKSLSKNIESRFGKLKEFIVRCNNCNNEFSVEERETKFPSKNKYFCSRSCANTRSPTIETKSKISNSLIHDLIIKNCEHCSATFETNNTKKTFCSRSCSSKYRADRSRKYRDPLINYRADCAFRFSLNDYPDEFDFNLIETYGWYKAKNRGNNLTGVSRDHIVSVRYGFDNNIDPKIIAHPANCQLLQHGKNVSKGKSCNLTLQELLEKIEQWNLKYNI